MPFTRQDELRNLRIIRHSNVAALRVKLPTLEVTDRARFAIASRTDPTGRLATRDEVRDFLLAYVEAKLEQLHAETEEDDAYLQRRER
jgi:hypothetical protein